MTLILGGCMGIGGEQEAEAEKLEPISATDWPTPQPTERPATPTPFPKVTLAPTATRIPSPEPESTANPTASSEELAAGGDVNALIEQVTAASGGLTPVATGLVRAESVPIRQGPDDSYGSVGTATQSDLFAVFGTDPSGDWLYVLTIKLLRGWLPADSVRVTGSLEDAPVLPANPNADEAVASEGPTSAAPSSPPAAAPGAASFPVEELEPVTSARVNNQVVNMRQGPGAAYGQLGSLSQDDEVSVLAFNRTRDWVLVRTAGGEHGWVSLPFLQVDGSLDGIPVVISPTPDKSIPPGQVAPIRPAESSAAPVEPNQEQARRDEGPVEPVPAAFNSAPATPALNPLAAVATAFIGRNEVELRPGPGETYAPFKTLTQTDEQLAVLGLDKSGNWALVDPAFSEPGWVVVSDLKVVDGSTANAPMVYTGLAESNAIEVRRGPGIYEDVIGSLSINTMVQVLGLNKGRSWAMVRPITGEGLGWTPVQLLNISWPLADLPEAPELPAPVQAAGQPAPAPQLPQKPLGETKLVFQTSSGGDIMVINGDGTGLRRLTAGIDPVLSPDGQTLAFTRWEGETGSLWTIGLDGSGEKSALGFMKQAKGPAWSPDGSKIVLNYQHGGRLEVKTDCYNLDQEGGIPRPPRNATNIRGGLDMSDFQPEICWDLPPDPHWGLRVVNLADGSFEDMDGGTYAFRPTWDPNQPWRIISDGGLGLVQVDVNTNQNQPVTDNVDDGSPVFSPDGRYLAVVTGRGGSGYDIYRMNADGGGRLQLTKTPLWITALPDNQKAWNNVAPAWSPDGSQIAFLTDRNGRWEIWVMNADGSDQRPLFSEEINNQLNLQYNFVDERVLSWG
jgi:uncharacterized protein YgiM (DUF1202 family)